MSKRQFTAVITLLCAFSIAASTLLILLLEATRLQA